LDSVRIVKLRTRKYPKNIRFSFDYDYFLSLFNWTKRARGILPMAKVAAANMALKVLDTAMQVHGAAGVSSVTVLAHLWATTPRTLRITYWNHWQIRTTESFKA
ncbi:unnamed protein product, partial [Brassica rapa subsp. trilocularis]